MDELDEAGCEETGGEFTGREWVRMFQRRTDSHEESM